MKFACAFLVVALALHAEAYSSGAPSSACENMVPKHPVDPRKDPAPYVITTNTKVVKAGTPVEVTISGKSSEKTIRGLMLQARVGNKPVGTFKLAPNDALLKLMECSKPDDTVSHKSHEPSDDRQVVTLKWVPPADLNDEVKFRATIALNGAVFWVGVESAPVKVTP